MTYAPPLIDACNVGLDPDESRTAEGGNVNLNNVNRIRRQSGGLGRGVGQGESELRLIHIDIDAGAAGDDRVKPAVAIDVHRSNIKRTPKAGGRNDGIGRFVLQVDRSSRSRVVVELETLGAVLGAERAFEIAVNVADHSIRPAIVIKVGDADGIRERGGGVLAADLCEVDSISNAVDAGTVVLQPIFRAVVSHENIELAIVVEVADFRVIRSAAEQLGVLGGRKRTGIVRIVVVARNRLTVRIRSAERVGLHDVDDSVAIHVRHVNVVSEARREHRGGHHRGGRIDEEAGIRKTLVDQELVVVILRTRFTRAGVTFARIGGVTVLVQVHLDGAGGFRRVVIGVVNVDEAVAVIIGHSHVAETRICGAAVLGLKHGDSGILILEAEPVAVTVLTLVVIDARLTQPRLRLQADRSSLSM